jgi:subfamily B ATP-binding cassette protein MsbA
MSSHEIGVAETGHSNTSPNPEGSLDLGRALPLRKARARKAGTAAAGRISGAVSALTLNARQDIEIFRRLLKLAKGFVGFLPPMAALALLSSLFEGFSLTLIIPLVQVLDTATLPINQGRLLDLLYDSVGAIPVEMRLFVVLAAILAAIIVKSAISYANSALFCLLYGRVSHTLRRGVFANILERPLAEVERELPGRLFNILNNETWRATDALNYLFSIITSAATMVVFVALLFLLSWRLSLVALVLMALIPPLLEPVTWRAK